MTNNFVDNGNGTVTDLCTGLMWEVKTDDGGIRDKDNTYTWRQALDYCENLSLADYDDWRLPNRNALQSLVDYSQYDPSIDTTFFPNTMTWLGFCWSSTTLAGIPGGGAWVVFFVDGTMQPLDKPFYSYVRAVRAGQCGSSITTTTSSPPSDLCPSEEIYGEDSEEVEILRSIRDNVLSQTPEGREIISLYYQWSPVIVQAMEEDEAFKEEVRGMIDGVLELITETE